MTSPQKIEQLLSRMSSDPGFCAHLAAEPGAALAQMGIALDPAMLPKEVRLPSAELIRAGRIAIGSKLQANAFDPYFFLDGKGR